MNISRKRWDKYPDSIKKKYVKNSFKEKPNIWDKIIVNINVMKIENQILCVNPLCFVGKNLKNKYKKIKPTET